MIAHNGETLGKPVAKERYHADRICIVKDDGGPVSLVLHAGNSLQVEAMVSIITADDEATAIEYLKIGTKNNSEATLQSAPHFLNNHRALIRFSAWSEHTNHYSGKIAIDVLQDNRHCTISKPAEWLRIVPKYGTGQAFEWITLIHFYSTPPKEES